MSKNLTWGILLTMAWDFELRAVLRMNSGGVSPFLAWGDFHARSRFARSTIPKEKWETTRSLAVILLPLHPAYLTHKKSPKTQNNFC